MYPFFYKKKQTKKQSVLKKSPGAYSVMVKLIGFTRGVEMRATAYIKLMPKMPRVKLASRDMPGGMVVFVAVFLMETLQNVASGYKRVRCL
jgi:hypothetical protein